TLWVQTSFPLRSISATLVFPPREVSTLPLASREAYVGFGVSAFQATLPVQSTSTTWLSLYLATSTFPLGRSSASPHDPSPPTFTERRRLPVASTSTPSPLLSQ